MPFVEVGFFCRVLVEQFLVVAVGLKHLRGSPICMSVAAVGSTPGMRVFRYFFISLYLGDIGEGKY